MIEKCGFWLIQLVFFQVLGASWYLLSIERYATCWKSICKKEVIPEKCLLKYLDCDASDDNTRLRWMNSTSVFSSCQPEQNVFNYGIFGNAVTNSVLSSNFLEKYLYCLWWGLQNLRYYHESIISCASTDTVSNRHIYIRRKVWELNKTWWISDSSELCIFCNKHQFLHDLKMDSARNKAKRLVYCKF